MVDWLHIMLWILLTVEYFNMQEIVVNIEVVGLFAATVTNIENTKTAVYVNVVVTNDLKGKFSHFWNTLHAKYRAHQAPLGGTEVFWVLWHLVISVCTISYKQDDLKITKSKWQMYCL